jgi:hypothetical protein
MRRIIVLACAAWIFMLGAVLPAAAESASPGGLPPWHFHMTPDQVRSFNDYSPYDEVGKDSLATHYAVFNGALEYVEFDFKDGGLFRLGVYLYYGTDLARASEVWGHSFTTLKSLYGDVKLPDAGAYGAASSAPTEANVAMGGMKIVQAGGKTRLTPATQPADAYVFSTFRSMEKNGKTHYFVILYYEPPRA